ncbi:MAG: NADH-quinone oxidoreductase subunit C [Deltaproteobacteria bacterium]|nr:MAG: NADH-quinone oxidoreductase subunit C [Deltaproteobacteria bacterium]
MTMKAFVEELSARFEVLWTHAQRDDLFQFGVPAVQAVPLLSYLKAHTPFIQLTHYTVVDWIEDGEFQMTYLLTDPVGRRALMICARIDRETAEADSLYKLWPQAVTYEHEMNEMFGIHFPGSPRMGLDFCLEKWTNTPPMRRDFDTVAFVKEMIPERPGREFITTRDYIGQKVGEKRLLHDD